MAVPGHIYFVSDLHLGAPSIAESLRRERHFVRWLDYIRADVQELFLVGDVFDFWFEYRRAVPKGYVRMLGRLAEMADSGIRIHIFSGNHDLWYRDYFKTEIGAEVYHKPLIRSFYGHTFYIAHGDGLGPGDHGYKMLKKVFTAPLSKWAYRLLHPDWGIGLANFFSGMSRNHKRDSDNSFLGEKEFLIAHSRKMLETQPDINYFVFGHRHILREEMITESARTVFLGDWIRFFSFLEVRPDTISLRQFPITDPMSVEINAE